MRGLAPMPDDPGLALVLHGRERAAGGDQGAAVAPGRDRELTACGVHGHIADQGSVK